MSNQKKQNKIRIFIAFIVASLVFFAGCSKECEVDSECLEAYEKNYKAYNYIGEKPEQWTNEKKQETD